MRWFIEVTTLKFKEEAGGERGVEGKQCAGSINQKMEKAEKKGKEEQEEQEKQEANQYEFEEDQE